MCCLYAQPVTSMSRGSDRSSWFCKHNWSRIRCADYGTVHYAQETQNVCITFIVIDQHLRRRAQHCLNVIQMFCACWAKTT